MRTMRKFMMAALAALTMAFTAQAAKTAKVVVEGGGTTLRFVYDETNYDAKDTEWFSVAEAEAINPNVEDVPWCKCGETVTKVVFDPSFAAYRPKQCGRWFRDFGVLAAVDGLANLNTSVATNMAYMFSRCFALTTLNLASFETANVTSMKAMFHGCFALTTLNLASFDTANVTAMKGMFGYCSSLTSLNLASFDTVNVTDMDYMFYVCSSLEAICASDRFVTDHVSDSSGMFQSCSKLVGGAGTEYDGDKTDATYARIDGKDDQPGYFTRETTAKAVVEDGGKTLRFVYDNLDIYGEKDVGWYSVAEAEAIDPHNDYVPWCDYVFFDYDATVTKVVFDPSFAAYRPKQCGRWFYRFRALAAVDGLTNLNTSVATSMGAMFCGCSSLTTLDVSSFDTANVTDMLAMFNGCSSLTTLDVSGFDTANVTDMRGMFYDCSSLTSLDLTGFDTANVTDMGYMFGGCSSLTTIDVSGFDTANVTDMGWMFYGCSSLEAICASDRFVTGQETFSYCMFGNCSKLVGGAGTKYDSNKTDKTYARIDGEGGQLGYFTPTAKAVVADGGKTLRFVYDGKDYGTKGTKWFSVAEAEKINPYNEDVPWCDKYSSTVTKVVFDPSFAAYRPKQCGAWFYGFGILDAVDGLKNLNTSVATNMAYMFRGCSSLTTLDVTSFDTANVTDMYGMFLGCSSLESLDLTGFDTANVTTMGAMFYGCSSLESLDLTGFKTANVTDMYGMFYDCSKLTSIDVSGFFNTWNVTDLSYMFYGCSLLTSIDVSDFNTWDVTDLSYMFYGCSSLTSLDVSGFNTANVTHMSSMFYGCSSLTSIDVSGFNTSNVTDLSYMFYGCSSPSLTTLNVSGFDTANVTHMSSMFEDCSSLTSLDVSGFVTANVTDMGSMFSGCSSLTTLDLSGFVTANVTDMYAMFYGCSSLEAICASDQFVTDRVSDSSSMFQSCSKLVGGAGTEYDSDKIDKAYARIDGKDGQSGYFTRGAVYTVAFVGNGATSGSMPSHKYGLGKVYNLPKCAFKKKGKAFKGWTGDNERRYDDGVLIFNAAAEGKVLTLTAVWE